MPQEIDWSERRHVLSSLSKGLRNIGTYRSAVDVAHATIRIRARVRNRNMMTELATGVLRVIEADGKARFLKDGRVEILNKGYLLNVSRDFRALHDLVRRAGFTMPDGPEDQAPASTAAPAPEPPPPPAESESAEPEPEPAEPEPEPVETPASVPVPSGPREAIPEWILEKYKSHIDAFETVVLRLVDQSVPISRKDLFEGTGFEDAGRSRAFLQALEAARMVRILGERRGTRYIGIRPAIEEALDMSVMLRHVVSPSDRKAWDLVRPPGAQDFAEEEDEDDVSEEIAEDDEPEQEESEEEDEEEERDEEQPAQETSREEPSELEHMREALEAQSEAMIRLLGREKELRSRVSALESKLEELLSAIRSENK